MAQESNQVNTIAPLKNVALCAKVMERAINSPAHLPRIVSFTGYSGYGKSWAAAVTANKFKAFYVECKSGWTKRALLEAILLQMGMTAQGPVYKLVDQVSEQLAKTEKALIIDEMDYLVKRSAVEIVRDIYEGSNAPILLIGEENMPSNLNKWERFHGRVLEWAYAQPADVQDVKLLASFYCKRVKIREDLIQETTKAIKGSVRRACVNLDRIEKKALGMGLEEIGMAEWGKTPFYTGENIGRNS